MKIAFAVSTLGMGGAERVLVNMANYWSKRGHSIEILTLQPKGNTPSYELDDGIVYSPLSLALDSRHFIQFAANNFSRIRVIRQAIRRSKPDVVISLINRMNVLVSLASIGLGIPVVVCEHSDPAQCSIGGRGWELLRRLTYSRADSVVVLTN